MRLRQVALIVEDLENSLSVLTDLLQAEICFRDPGVGFFGLQNGLIPLGSDFLEVLSPKHEETAGARHLARRGAGGYMLIFQCADGQAAREHALHAGARAVWQHDESGIHATHFHPRSLPGAIVSVDSMDESDQDYRRPDARWDWAGPDWKNHQRDNGIVGLSGAVIQTPDPSITSSRWKEVLDLPSPEGNPRTIQLDTGEILFESCVGEDPVFSSFKIRHTDVPGLLSRAQSLGLPHDEHGIDVTGIRIEVEVATP